MIDRKLHVADRGKLVKQGVVLKHQTHAGGSVVRVVTTAEGDSAGDVHAGVFAVVQPGDEFQEGCFTRTARADQ